MGGGEGEGVDVVLRGGSGGVGGVEVVEGKLVEGEEGVSEGVGE